MNAQDYASGAAEAFRTFLARNRVSIQPSGTSSAVPTWDVIDRRTGEVILTHYTSYVYAALGALEYIKVRK